MKPIIEKVAESLAYALTYDTSDRVEQRNIISDFVASLNRRGVVKTEETEELDKLINERIGALTQRTPKKTRIDAYLTSKEPVAVG